MFPIAPQRDTGGDVLAVAGMDTLELVRINLTRSDYHGVITAARAGTEVTPHSSVAVQLAAQEAKAWSRMGDLLFHLMPESAAISGNFSRQS